MARQQLATGQGTLDLGLEADGGGSGVPSSGAGADHRADEQAGPGSRARGGRDALVSYRTMRRRLPVYAGEGWRKSMAAACARQAKRSLTG